MNSNTQSLCRLLSLALLSSAMASSALAEGTRELVMLATPTFGAGDPISSYSSTDGVCRMYGYANGVAAEIITIPSSNLRLARIDGNGQFVGFDYATSVNQIGNTMCETGRMTVGMNPALRGNVSSIGIDMIELLNPMLFGYRISTNTSAEGLCAMAGYRDALPGSMVTLRIPSSNEKLARLGFDGTVAGLDSATSVNAVEQVYCKGAMAGPMPQPLPPHPAPVPPAPVPPAPAPGRPATCETTSRGHLYRITAPTRGQARTMVINQCTARGGIPVECTRNASCY